MFTLQFLIEEYTFGVFSGNELHKESMPSFPGLGEEIINGTGRAGAELKPFTQSRVLGCGLFKLFQKLLS